MNSISTVFTMDILKRFGWSPAGTVGELRMARIVTLMVGVFTTLGAVLLLQRQTTILETVGSLTAKFVGPITGVFFLGVLARRCRVLGAAVGMLAGAAAGWLVEWNPVAQRVNWMWIAPCSTIITFTVGWAVSLLTPKLREAK
jgi:Na+/proline symporter